jgi:flagellar protein FlgJ
MSDISSINLQNKAVEKATTEKATPTAEMIAKDKKLKKACTDFEAMLVYQMMKSMRQTIPKSGFLSNSHGKETYEMMFDQKIAEAVANKGDGLGVQKILYNQLKAKYLK